MIPRDSPPRRGCTGLSHRGDHSPLPNTSDRRGNSPHTPRHPAHGPGELPAAHPIHHPHGNMPEAHEDRNEAIPQTPMPSGQTQPFTKETQTAMTPTLAGAPPAQPPRAAAGGDHRTQLIHLRAHRAFQRSTGPDTARIAWNTVINRTQSRRHIRQHLHTKINAKNPREHSRGRMDTPQAQDSMEQLARRIRGRHRLSPGDGHHLTRGLRLRMTRTAPPHFQDNPTPREADFPPEVRAQHQEIREKKRLLTLQGASPRRHRQARVIHLYACRRCRNLTNPQDIQDPQGESGDRRSCPVCHQGLEQRNLIPVAVRDDGSSSPLGVVRLHNQP